MKEPDWYDRLPKWAQELVDQSGHVTLGVVAGSVLWIAHPMLAGAAAGLVVAAAREREQWPPRRWWDLVLDVVMVTVGGLAMGTIVWRAD